MDTTKTLPAPKLTPTGRLPRAYLAMLQADGRPIVVDSSNRGNIYALGKYKGGRAEAVDVVRGERCVVETGGCEFVTAASRVWLQATIDAAV